MSVHSSYLVQWMSVCDGEHASMQEVLHCCRGYSVSNGHSNMQALKTYVVDVQLGSQHRVWGSRILVGLLMLCMALLYAGIWVYLQYYR